MPEGSCAFAVGTFRCTVLSDGYADYPAEWYFANVEPEQVRRSMADRGLPTERVLSPFTCLLIETGRHVILFDAGAGLGARTGGAATARLEMAGIRPRHVDTVILSHAHPDHAGGAVDERRRPAFPNARYIVSEREWEFWTGRADLASMAVPQALRDSLRASARLVLSALRHQLEPVEGEQQILPGLTLLPAPGHTPGHLALAIESEGEALLALADAAFHPLHLERLEWNNALDLAPEMAAQTRCALLRRSWPAGLRVLGFHFPFPSVGRVEALDGGGWRWRPGI